MSDWPDRLLKTWLQEHAPKAPGVKNGPAFFHNLEAAMDVQRADLGLMTVRPRWPDSVVDLTSSDFLSLNKSGLARKAFEEELTKGGHYPQLSASGARVQYGNYPYLLETEQRIADWYGTETAVIVHSGFFSNVGIVGAIPLPGDAIVYDELVHASSHDGMKLSVAAHKLPFAHNDPESLRDVLTSLKQMNPAFAAGTKSILILIESIYSMTGDCCPIRECVTVAKEVFPLGNAQFVIDEAHSTGVIGPQGKGLVAELGMQKEIAIQIYMSSKALASTGAVICCNKTVRRAIIDKMRFLVYGGAPSFPMVCSIRAGYNLLMDGDTEQRRGSVQNNVKYFFKRLGEQPTWEDAVDEGLLWCPLMEDWETRKFQTHVIPIRCKPGHQQWLYYHFVLNEIQAFGIGYPIVPKGQAIMRLVFHADNTYDEIDKVVLALCEWAEEMLDIKSGVAKHKMPKAARQVFAMQAEM